MTHILMVCLGNICRSPLAEGILKSKVDLKSVYVDSTGTGEYHIGKPPDSRSIAVAHKHGLDITEQRCRKFEMSDFKKFDLIFVMDKSNYKNIMALAPDDTASGKVKLILNEINISEKEVPDPYYDKKDGFENVYRLLDQACEAIASTITEPRS